VRPLPVLGAVLAGGRSRRFGSPKATASFRGGPLVTHPVRTLEAVCERVLVVGASSLRKVVEVPVILDIIPGAGPLGGLHGALRAAEGAGLGGVFLLGCDMPLVTPAVVEAVIRAGLASGRPAAAPQLSGGALHPLCAWYSLDCLPEAEHRLGLPGTRGRSPAELLQSVEARPIPVAELPGVGDPELLLRGANTPEELAELEEGIGVPVAERGGAGPA